MARDDDRDAVVSVRVRDGTHGRWLSNVSGDRGVSRRRADWNSLKLRPHTILERCTRRAKRNRELAPLGPKVFVELLANHVDDRRLTALEHAVDPATHAFELRIKQLAMSKLEQEQVCV